MPLKYIKLHSSPFRRVSPTAADYGLYFLPRSVNLLKNKLCVMIAGLLAQAHEQLKEAVYLYGRACDDLHPEAGYCHTLLAKVAYLQGKTAEVC